LFCMKMFCIKSLLINSSVGGSICDDVKEGVYVDVIIYSLFRHSSKIGKSAF